MKLVMEILTGSLFYVEVLEDATVADLKKQIAEQENLPKNRLILMLDTQPCTLLDKDEAPLEDYGIRDSSHVYIFFEPIDDGNGDSHRAPSPKKPPSSPIEASSPPTQDTSSPKEVSSSPKEAAPEEPTAPEDVTDEPSDQDDKPSATADPSSDPMEDC